ncbi:2'-5' RNA ligase family protein [Pseudonocardia phyllosphaerae]|uniref:2'-5' RNA ligase family protein n=1 Tax=Pseudonocardia phyllosphaerae TaxID=3390502 RepID=UPI00397AC0A7
MDDRPLILTGVLDEPVRRWLDDLRERHFPPQRNHLAAHLTLFHALPADDADAVTADVRAAASERPPLAATVTGPRLLGRGVALRIDCPELLALRRSLAARRADRLTRQDATKNDLHVTVQNKVDPDTARRLYDELAALEPQATTVTGLALWRYDGGPWAPAGRFAFGG